MENPCSCAVIVDYREAALIELLEEAETASLPVGDILVCRGGAPRLLLERKSVADLASSVKDGRWKEQTDRLKGAASEHPDRSLTAGIVVEGDLSGGAGGLSASALSNALLSASVRKGLVVVYSGSVRGTAELVRKSCRCLGRPASSEEEAEILSRKPGRLPGRARTERGVCCAATAGAAMLTVVPGVSASLAAGMMAGHGSIAALVGSLLSMTEEERVSALSEVRHASSGRRAGAALAARVNGMLLG